MAMGKRRRHAEQASMWVATQDLPRTAAHPFDTRLNQILDKHDFDEGLCQRFYADDIAVRRKHRVSSTGASEGLWWRQDGKQLMFVSEDNSELLVANVLAGDEFTAGASRVVGHLPKGVSSLDAVRSSAHPRARQRRQQCGLVDHRRAELVARRSLILSDRGESRQLSIDGRAHRDAAWSLQHPLAAQWWRVR